MKFWFTDVHDMTSDIRSSSSLVDFDFLFPDCDSSLCDSEHNVFVDVFIVHLSLGVYESSG